MKKYLVTGGGGQDGVIISRILAKQNEDVTVTCRPESQNLLSSVQEGTGIKIVSADLGKTSELLNVLQTVKPSHIINLAGSSSVSRSWDAPSKTLLTNTVIPAEILTWIVKNSPETKYLQASSSEIFGGLTKYPQTEEDSLAPVTPYGISKVATHQLVRSFREKYSIFASSAILYNHESPLRPVNFVTRKISQTVAKIALGSDTKLHMGDLSATRDWGWAPDHCRGMLLAIDHDYNDDFIFATGKSRTVSSLLSISFNLIGINNYQQYLEISTQEVRSIDPANLVGDSTKAHHALGWQPKVNLEEVMHIMISSDIERLKNGNSPKIERNIISRLLD